MSARAVVDVATLRSASRLILADKATYKVGESDLLDLDISALGNLVEGLLMFDSVSAANLSDDLDLSDLDGPLLEAVPLQEISDTKKRKHELAAARWLEQTDIDYRDLREVAGLDVRGQSRTTWGTSPRRSALGLMEGRRPSETTQQFLARVHLSLRPKGSGDLLPR